LLKQITATLYCEAVNSLGALRLFTTCCELNAVKSRAVVGADGGFFFLCTSSKGQCWVWDVVFRLSFSGMKKPSHKDVFMRV
jgi:hypothetical protein